MGGCTSKNTADNKAVKKIGKGAAAGFTVAIIPMNDDNFCYYVYQPADIQNGFFVDVAKFDKLETFMREMSIEKCKTVISTHKHWDHTDGNEGVKAAFPDVEIIGGEIDKVKECTKEVKDKQEIDVFGGAYKLICHLTPCHTKGHITFELVPKKAGELCFEFGSSVEMGYQTRTGINRCVFTGDTVFIGGCGRFFEGDAEGMLNAMNLVMKMSPDTKMFCGHEYTISNLKFCVKAEGETNPKCEEALTKFTKMVTEDKTHSVPTLIRDELQYNVFMRCNEANLLKALGETEPVKAMHCLREWKNTGNKPEPEGANPEEEEEKPVEADKPAEDAQPAEEPKLEESQPAEE